ncbi:hypothetical protein BDV96DRAFT_649265 [Lophiotrema nucula]|uniref:Fungal N-terminal domain-containing protein n=1 Tax=Lophiotrema nucula TaxID=690887 RepID=A0A6A5Z2B4_9PLEO|nr:hypothetical protein BDV96DRAFT_649265 [Lophiotrema nucula]
MADPLSFGAGIVSIIVPALHGVRLLLDDLNRITDAPQAIQALKNDASKIQNGRVLVEQSRIKPRLPLRAARERDLKRWTRHSQDGKLSWKEKANVGIFKERQVKAMSEQLQSCKSTFNAAVGVSHDNNRRVAAIASAEVQLTELHLQLQKIRFDDSQPEQGQIAQMRNSIVELETDVKTAIRQIEEEQIALACSKDILDKLLEKADAAEKEQWKGRVSFGHSNSGFQAYTVNGGIHGMTFGAKG